VALLFFLLVLAKKRAQAIVDDRQSNSESEAGS